MKTILTIIGILFGVIPKHSGIQMGYAAEKQEESKYSLNQLLDAIAIVESNNKPSAVGDNGEAVGAFQIHKIYVDDVNRILGYPRFNYSDRYNYNNSRFMVSVYLQHYGKDKSIEAMARIHNGGPRGYKKQSTIRYWQKVKRILDKEQ